MSPDAIVSDQRERAAQALPAENEGTPLDAGVSSGDAAGGSRPTHPTESLESWCSSVLDAIEGRPDPAADLASWLRNDPPPLSTETTAFYASAGMPEARCRAIVEAYRERLPRDIPHLHDMWEPMLGFLPARREKFMRWLGFVQGVLWYDGLYSIEQLQQHNAVGEVGAPYV